jgi:hypothetical protein
MTAKLKDLRQKLRKNLHARTGNTVKWLKTVVRGYFQYYAAPRNERRLKAFRHEVLRMWWWQLRRRSQRTRWRWNKFMEKLGNQIPEVETLHPYPEVRFALNRPRIWAYIRGKNVCVMWPPELCGVQRASPVESVSRSNWTPHNCGL